MKANNTPDISDLARWIDLQLSTIIEGVSAGYSLGNYNAVWIDRGETVFTVSLANDETVEIDSDNYNSAKEIADAIIATINNTPATMNANETTANVLTLSKCAYMFHWSNSTFTYGNSEYRARKGAINNALKAIYNNPEKGVNIPYIIENGCTYIELDGVKIDVCDTMLQSVSGEYPRAEIVNGRTFKPLRPFYDSFKPGTFDTYRDSETAPDFWGAKLKSLHIESFPGADSLRYYRLHFRGNRLDLIASNGKTYNAGCDNYSEINTREILNRLDAESKAARKIIVDFVKYIKA